MSIARWLCGKTGTIDARFRRIGVAAALSFFCFTAVAGDLALVGATVYPDPQSHAIRDAVVVVRNGVIAAVGPRAKTALPDNTRVIDVSGMFVTAGYWNSHVHILTPGLLHAAQAGTDRLNRELDTMFNRRGFTTVFDTGSVLANTQALGRRIESREVRGPRILTVGEPIWTKVPSYIRDYLKANRIEMPEVHTPREAARHVRSLAARGADGIKLFTGSIQRGHIAHMPMPIARAAVAEAHRLHLPVFAHAQDTRGFETAVDAGIDVLAHLTPGTGEWTPTLVSRLTGSDTALIPTLTLFDFEARRDGVSEEVLQRLLDRMVAQLRAFAAGGGTILFGTDTGYTTHFDTTLEFELMAKAGLDYRRILATLTTNPARRFEPGHNSGRVAPGYDGDLVVLAADPARDSRNFARVRYTIRAGEIIYSAH